MRTTTTASSKAIFEHVFNQMKLLSAKAIDVEEAKAQAHLAKQANNILKYELDRATAIAKYGDEFQLREIEG